MKVTEVDLRAETARLKARREAEWEAMVAEASNLGICSLLTLLWDTRKKKVRR
jgi:hypothetical protein